MKKNNYLFTILLFLMYIIISSTVYSALPCGCLDDRILKLQRPYLEGDDITTLQEQLKKYGFYQGKINSKYDALTAEAVKQFQNKHGLISDGVVGSRTWGMLICIADPFVLANNENISEDELKIVINLYSRRLTLYINGEPHYNYPVTIGKKETPSPVGEWKIISKAKKPENGPLGSRWLGLNVPWGVYGIHGTNRPQEIGVAASAGCIRLHNLHVEKLFELVPLKTRVFIKGKREKVNINRVLKPGFAGKQVMQLQIKLKNKGFYNKYLDAAYSKDTENAVKELESLFGLKTDGIADHNVLQILENL